MHDRMIRIAAENEIIYNRFMTLPAMYVVALT